MSKIKCPECSYKVTVSREDPSASIDEMYGHLLPEHAGYDVAKARRLLAQVTEV